MASYLAQLGGLRMLFSVSDLNQTYFHQLPLGIADLKNILTDSQQLEESLNRDFERKEEFINRRNRVLDHLLARFGEKLDEASLKKISRSSVLDSSENWGLTAIQTKVNLLKQIII